MEALVIMHDSQAGAVEAIPASPQLQQLLDESDDILLTVRLDTELQALRAAEPRVDTKAGNLQQLGSGLLIAGLALLGSGKLPGPAAAAGWAAAALLGGAVTLASLAIRPNLRGRFGFVRWAAATSDQQLLDELAAEPASGDCVRQAGQLRWLSQSLRRKFTRVRTAQTLLMTALAVAALAAALAATGR
jgi:hypothetical protein